MLLHRLHPHRILDITSEDLRVKFLEGVRNISAICLQIGYPTIASIPHSIANGLKNLIAISIEADVDLKEAQKAKDYLADPSKFVVAAAPAAGKFSLFSGQTKASSICEFHSSILTTL